MAEPEQPETWEQRRARLQTETPDEQRARQISEYDHHHDVTGHFLRPSDYTPDGSMPQDPLSGVHVDENTKPWHHFVGHPEYAPHPDSIAAQ